MRALVALIVLMVCSATAAGGVPPRAALPYRDAMIRITRSAWGLDGPVATFAGQIETESAWNPRARSPVGAVGMAQFMPSTARWICGTHPELPPGCDTLSPSWAMQALVTYDRAIYQDTPAGTRCGRMWAALRGYNGGIGYWLDEWRIAGRPADLREADDACGLGRRSVRYCAENLSYPRDIIRAQPRYFTWGTGVCDASLQGRP